MAGKILCIVNKLSGGGKAQQIWSELSRLRDLEPHRITLVDICSHSISEINPHEFVFIAGGDGTVSSCLAALCDSSSKIAIIPLGVGNDLAREMGLLKLYRSLPLSEYLDRCTKLESQELQLWEISSEGQGSHTFCNYLSFGFDAAVALRFAAARRKLNYFGRIFKRLLYACLGLREAFAPRLSGLELVCAGKRMQLPALRTLAFFNIASYMGVARIDSRVSPFDQLLDCVAIKSIFSYLQLLCGLPRHSASSEVVASGQMFEVSGIAPGTAMQIDGEGMVAGASAYQIRPKSTVRVLVAYN